MKAAYQVVISFFLLAVISVQTIASFGYLHAYRFWPFLSYPMYNNPHYVGDTVAMYSLVGILDDRREVSIPAEDLNLSFFQFLNGPVRAILREDRESLLPYAADWQRRHGEHLAALRLENRAVGLAEDGTFQVPIETRTIYVGGGAL